MAFWDDAIVSLCSRKAIDGGSRPARQRLLSYQPTLLAESA